MAGEFRNLEVIHRSQCFMIILSVFLFPFIFAVAPKYAKDCLMMTLQALYLVARIGLRFAYNLNIRIQVT